MNHPHLSDRDWAIILAALRVYERSRPGLIDSELIQYINDIETNGGIYEMPDLTPNGDVDRIAQLINTCECPTQEIDLKTWEVTISRTSYYESKTYTVKTDLGGTADIAEELAKEQACNDSWSEKNSRYEIEDVILIS